jgi:hypothetical protein
VSGVGGLSGGEVLLGGAVGEGWWLVVDEDGRPGRVVAGPFPGRTEAAWATAAHEHAEPPVRPVYGVARPDGGLTRRPSPQDWAWLAHLEAQLDRLPPDWDAGLDEDDPLVTLIVEVTAALAEAGLPLYGDEVGGACLTAEPGLGGIVVSWRQHDRMSVDQVHGAEADGLVQHVMNRALADVLALRGFDVEAFGDAGGSVVRRLQS